MLEGCKINVLNQMTQAMVICHAALHRNLSAFVNYINDATSILVNYKYLYVAIVKVQF